MITPRQRNALPVFNTLDWDPFVLAQVSTYEMSWFQHKEFDWNQKGHRRRRFRHCEEDTWVALLMEIL